MDKKKMVVTFEAPLDCATIIPIHKFINDVENYYIMDDDGIGYLAKEDEEGKVWESAITVDCYSAWLQRFLEDFTHVCWYGK
jgi:hypothetical protein